jgi:chromate transporter
MIREERSMSSDSSILVEILAVIAFSTLFSLGGGNGQLAIIQDHWVDPGLLSPALFAWAYAIGNFVPGPKCSFVAGIGYFLAGFPGAIACLIGISIPTVFGASLAAHWHDNLKHYVALFMPASGFVIAGMMLTAGTGLARNISIDPLEYLLVGLVVLGVWLKRWDPGVVVLGSAGFGVLVYVSS